MRALPWVGLVFVLGLASAGLDEDAGVGPWLHLRSELADARGRIEALRGEISALHVEVTRLEEGGFALERAIREELELVRPGQTLVRLPGQALVRPPHQDVPSARIP